MLDWLRKKLGIYSKPVRTPGLSLVERQAAYDNIKPTPIKVDMSTLTPVDKIEIAVNRAIDRRKRKPEPIKPLPTTFRQPPIAPKGRAGTSRQVRKNRPGYDPSGDSFNAFYTTNVFYSSGSDSYTSSSSYDSGSSSSSSDSGSSSSCD